MTTLFVEKTIRFLGKSDNTSSEEILSQLMLSSDNDVRGLAFDALYRKKKPEVHILLFNHFVKNEKSWADSPNVGTERLSKLADAAFRSDNRTLREQAAEIIVRYKLYETLPAVVRCLEGDDAPMAARAKAMLLSLSQSFYRDLVDAPSDLERRNLDRKREWFVQQLDAPIKRFASNRIDELIPAMLIVTKKDYDTIRTILADHRSSACAKVVELLKFGEHGSYLRLLLSYVPDSDSPAVIDEILTTRSDPVFVRKMLEIVGTAPSMDLRDSLKRFKGFDWFKPRNPQLPELLHGLEPNAIQLLMAGEMSKSEKIELHRFFLNLPSIGARRASAEALRRLVGDDANRLLLEHVNDSDAETAATIFRILKARNVPELDQHFIQLLERSEEKIRSAIYETVPELRVESFASRINQLTPFAAKKMGRYVRLVDPNTLKVISDDIMSPIPVRRYSACAVAAATGYAAMFQERLIDLVDTDDETNVRIAAMSALGTIMTKEAVEVIKSFLNDRSMDIRDAASEALRNWISTYQTQTQGNASQESSS